MNSLLKQELGSLKIEVIVVSNLPDEKLKQSLQQFHSEMFPIHYCFTGAVGVNQARNLGIKNSVSDLVLFLDDDVILDNSRYIQTMFSHATAHPEAAAIGGRYQLPKKVSNSDKAYFNISDSWLTQGKHEDNSATHLVGGNTLYNKKVLRHHLRFNENITFGGAETELNLKIYQANLPIFLFDDIGITHITNLSPKKLLRKGLLQGMGRAYHELVVHPDIWKRNEIAVIPNRKAPTGNVFQKKFQTLLINFYNLFFRIGYRYGKISNFDKLRFFLLIKCILIEFFGLDPEQVIKSPNPAAEYSVFRAIFIKLVSYIPFWRIPWFIEHVLGRIPWFMKHVVGSRLWRIPWFLKWRIFSIILTKMWLIPWFYKYKFVPWFVSLFSEAWRIPWFMRWVVLIRIKAVSAYSWILPWILRHRIWPVFPLVFSKIWLIPWFIRWKILPWFAFWKLPWWLIPWAIKHHILSHFWKLPWLVKWRLIPASLFVVVFAINMFFPVNTIGLLTFYAAFWVDLERFIKKPWSNI
jgi:glycosyltransferase involved in cell wall biosynthesis